MRRLLTPPLLVGVLVAVLLRVVPAGPDVIELIGPLAIQSLVGLLVGALLMFGAGAPSVRLRQGYFLVAAALLIAGICTAPLPTRASQEVGTWMGDSDTYTADRDQFETYFGDDVVRFHFHLATRVLNLIDRALGSTATSPGEAFHILPGLVGFIALLEAAAVAILAGWSPQSMRYIGLCIAAPFALMFFGYRELGYLALSVAAFPLYLMTIDRPEDARAGHLIRGAATLQGLHAALHGFGLAAVATLMAMALTSASRIRTAVSNAWTVFVCAFVAYAIWLPMYLIVLGLPIVPGHATGIPIRHLVHSYVAERRLVEPLFSLKGFRDIGAEALVVGVPVVLFGLLVAGQQSRRAVLAGAGVSLAVMLLVWPAQGIGQDIDTVLAIFPAFFAGAWLAAARPWTAVSALCSLGIGHAVFWLVVRSEAFTNPGV
jgi:hypothetical protein